MNIATALRVQVDHVFSFWKLRQHFKNPWLIAFLRLGLVKLRYFPYTINNGSRNYQLLGRPTTTSAADLFVLREVLVEETYKDVIPLLPKKPLRVVDIGANLGAFTVWLGKTAQVQEAFCFEPEPDSFRLLTFNLAHNGCDFAHILRKAVGGQTRTGQILLKEDSPGGTSIYSAPSNSRNATGSAIEVIAFSEWLSQVSGQFDLLKMDCEGAEWEIVRRTSKAEFARFKAIVAEIHSDPEGKQSVEEFGKAMESQGFRTIRWDRKPQGLYVGVRDS